MDDKKFDDIIREKMEHFEPESYDPAALADLHYRMSSYPEPWYKRYSTELMIISAIVLATLLNGIISWTATNNKFKKLNNEISALSAENKLLESDGSENLSSFQDYKDTVYMMADNSLLIREIDRLNRKFDQWMITEEQKQRKIKAMRDNGIIFLGSDEEIPEELLYVLRSNGRILSDGKYNYLVSAGQTTHLSPIAPESGLVSMTDKFMFVTDYIRKDKQFTLKKHDRTLHIVPVKILRDIERHYMKGVGIKIGPTLGVIKPSYNVGSGLFKPSIGLLADLIVSPSLSIETGINYNVWNNEIETEDGFNNINLPGLDPQLGELFTAESDAFVLEFPVAFKYRYPMNDKTNMTASFGYSPVLFLQQDFEYDYHFISNDPVLSLEVNTAVTESNPAFYPGTVNLSLGISRQIKKDNYLEFSLQYKYGLTEMGVEGVKPGILGLRGGYWFKIR